MHKFTLYLTFYLFLFFLPFASYGQDIVVSGLPHEINNYKKWLGDKKCSDIKSYQNDYATKASIQIMIICKALHLGGIKAKLSFNSMPNYSRSLYEAQKGTIDIPGDSIWQSQIPKNHFYTAPPIFDKVNFKKVSLLYLKNEKKLNRR